MAKKINLEAQWNKLFLEQGRMTADMQWLEVELKEIKRQLLQQDLENVKEQNTVVFNEEEDPSYIAS